MILYCTLQMNVVKYFRIIQINKRLANKALISGRKKNQVNNFVSPINRNKNIRYYYLLTNYIFESLVKFYLKS